MDAQHSPEAPRDPRGASSWDRRVNDSTVEWLAAYSRIMAVAWSFPVITALLYLIWTPSWPGALTVALILAWATGHAWLGFVHLGNPEWKDDNRGEAAE